MDRHSVITISIVVVIAILAAVTYTSIFGISSLKSAAIMPSPVPDMGTGRNAVVSTTTEPVAVYFLDTKSSEYTKQCGVTKQVRRNVLANPQVMDSTMRVLFSGPTDAETAVGLASPFQAAQASSAATIPLGLYYQGVTVQNGLATVSFQGGALDYFQASGCLPENIKTSIEQTLLQFNGVRTINYIVDGVPFTAWK
jgi:spore germination protein GerM